jgi:hypothetical protein
LTYSSLPNSMEASIHGSRHVKSGKIKWLVKVVRFSVSFGGRITLLMSDFVTEIP